MMIVTNMKSLFVKRNRRLKKIQAGEGSSDESEAEDENHLHFSQESYSLLGGLDQTDFEEEGSDYE